MEFMEDCLEPTGGLTRKSLQMSMKLLVSMQLSITFKGKMHK